MTVRSRKYVFLPLAIVLFFWVAFPSPAFSQGVAQVTIVGIPSPLTPPSIGGQIQRYNEGRYAFHFIFSNPGAQPAEFSFRFLLERDGQTLIDVTSLPTLYQPGSYRYQTFDDPPSIRFEQSLASVLKNMDSRLGGQTTRTGLLPEGTYTLTIEPIVANQALLLPTIPGMATFIVNYAEPPVLITPGNDDVVSPLNPVFTWSAVVGLTEASALEYELLIVELYPNQTPQQAIVGNPPRLRTTTHQTTFTYGPDQLPLEEGKRYAWQVTARDPLSQQPLLNEGKTEIFTFRISQMPGGEGIPRSFTWRYPPENPIVVFEIGNAVVGLDRVSVSGRFQGSVAGQPMQATFDQVVLGTDGRIYAGSVTFDRPIAFLAAIDQTTGAISEYQARRSGTELTTQSALAFEPAIVRLTTEGIKTVGTGTAAVRYRSIDLVGLTATFSNDFTMGTVPLKIVQGRVVFAQQGVVIGYADATGFYPSVPTQQDLIALVPERLPLPHLNVAYALLRRGGELLVDVTTASDGSIVLSPKAGEQLRLVFAALQGQPEVPVSFENLRLAPGTQNVSSGRIVASGLDPFSQQILLSRQIPLRLEAVEYTRTEGLILTGSLVVFGEALEERGTVRVRVNESGSMQGVANLSTVNKIIPLVSGSDRVGLLLKQVNGVIDINLLSGDPPYYSLGMETDFVVQSGGRIAAALGLNATLNSLGQLTITRTTSSMPQDPVAIDLGAFRLAVTQIRSLSLSYNPSAGFDFSAGLDLSLLVRAGAHEFGLPFSNVELRRNGFFIPEQDINDSQPGFRAPPFEFGPLQLRLLAFRLPAVTFDWFNWNLGSPSGLLPRFDFEVNFPGFRDLAGELAYAPVTLQNVGLDGSYFSGNLVPYEFRGDGVLVPFEPGGKLGLRIKRIEGGLSRSGDAQGFDIRMTGVLHAPTIFPADTCSPPAFTVRLASRNGFEGRIENVTFCQTMQVGPIALTFASGFLDFRFAESRQQVNAGGLVTAVLTAPNFSRATATGTFALDLMSGRVTQSTLVFRNLSWSYPASDPFFNFTLAEATVAPTGLVLNGGGTLRAGAASVNVNFNGVGVGFEDGKIMAGDIEITGGFSIEIGISPLRWSVVNKTSLAQTDSNRALLVLQPGLRLNRDGLLIRGSSSAYVNALGRFEENLTVVFDEFQIGFHPFGVQSGRADLNTQGGRVGFIDRTGFHIDNPLAILPIPERLPLVSERVAYLVLKDQQGNYLVDLGNLNAERTGRSLKTKEGRKVKLVIAALGQQGTHPELELAFDLTVNPTTYQIVSGSIDLDLGSSPVNLSDYGFPLDMTRLRFASDGSAFRLTAGTKLNLPAKLAGMNVPVASELTFSNNGFEAAQIDIGTFSQQRSPNASATQPLAGVMLGDSAIGINVRGVRLVITQNSTSFGFCGDLDSKLFGTVNKAKAQVHYVAQFNAQQRQWDFSLNTSHLPDGRIPISKAFFSQAPNTPPTLTITPEVFALSLAGTISIPELSESFALSIQKLYLGTDKVEVQADAQIQQRISLFNDFLGLTISRIGVDYSSAVNVLYMEMDGSMDTKIGKSRQQQGQPVNQQDLIEFKGLRVGTDGSFSLGQGQVNLLAGRPPLQVLPNIFWLNELSIGYRNEAFMLALAGTVELPMPGRTAGIDTANAVRSAVRFAMNHRGEVVEPLQLTFAFDPGPVPRIGNNPQTEITFGDIATVELTGAALDFDVISPANTTLYATAAVHLHSRGSPVGQGQANTDANGKNRVFSLGNPTNIRNDYGIRYSFAGGLQYRVNIQASEDNPLFEFSAGMFRISLSQVSLPNPSEFKLTLGGRAGLELAGISGSFGFTGFTFGQQGVTDWGRPSGSISLSVMNVVSLELGGFEFQRQSEGEPAINLVRTKVSVNAQGQEVSEQLPAVQVKEFLRFTNAQISLGSNGAFSGGVREVLYYRTTGNGVFFFIDDANFQMGAAATLRANLEFASDQTGFLLRVAGIGKIQNVGFLATGKIANINNQLSFGIFLAVTGVELDLIPIAPRTIVLTGAGGGFFYRPETADLQLVVNSLTQMTGGEFRFNNPNGVPRAQNLTFAVLLYAQVGLVGGSGTFAIQGNCFLMITDQFASIDVNGTVLGQTGKLSGGAYLTFIFPKADGSFAVQGGIRLDVVYSPMATGNIRVDFFISRQGSNPLQWAAWGNATIRVMSYFTMNGNFMVSNNGMLVNLRYVASLEVKIITIQGRFDLSFWYYTTTKSLGVYAELDVRAEVLDGVATIGATLRGALLIDGSGYLIYAAARAYVKVLAVFEGEIGIWLSVRNGRVDGGTGSNANYDRMIENSRNQAAQLNQEARTLQAQIEQARREQFSFSALELQQAGMKLRMLPYSERLRYASEIYRDEEMYWPSTRPHPIFRMYADSLFVAPNQPSEDEAKRAFEEMHAKLEQMRQRAAEVAQRIQELEVQAIELRQRQEQRDVQIRSPLDFQTEEYRFTVDTDLESRQTEKLSALKEDTEALDAYYRSAITKGFEMLGQLESVLTGNNGVNEFLPVFFDTYTAVGRYYALRSSFHYGSIAWARWALGFIDATRTQLWDAIYAQANAVRDGTTREQGRVLATMRFKSIKMLAEASDTLLARSQDYAMDLAEYRNYIAGRRTDSEVREEMINKGRDLWYSVPRYSLGLFSQYHTSASSTLYSEYVRIVWNNLRQRYQEITAGVSRLYAMKSKMIETQVAFLDGYLSWRGDDLPAEEAETFRAQRRALALSLEPPRLTAVTVTPNRVAYHNILAVKWTATHPSGQVPESIVRIIRGYDDLLVTLGAQQSLTYYAFGENLFRQSIALQFEIAVRSPGGTLFFTRTNQINVPVAPEGENQSGVVSGETSVLPPSASQPPSVPKLVIPIGTFQSSYWVSDPRRISFVASSYDPAGSRVTFEATVGTPPQTTNVLGWTPMPSGKTLQQVFNPYLRTLWEQTVGQQLELGTGQNELPIAIEGLSLQPGVRYTVSVRATNAFAATSGLASFPVTYDATPPVFGLGSGTITVEQVNRRAPTILGGTGAAPQRPTVIQPWDELERIRTTQRLVQPVGITVAFPAATDPESGIYRYEYVISTNPIAEVAFGSETVVAGTAEPSRQLLCAIYDKPFYVHIRAVNHGGGLAYFTVGPHPPVPDPTLPEVMQTRIGYYGEDLVLWITSPAFDKETGIRGYQYAIGTDASMTLRPAGTTNLRAWPADTTVDFREGMYDIPLEGNLAPGFIVRNTRGIEAADPIYFYTRAVNGQGMFSDIWPTGGNLTVRDQTPPILGSLVVEYFQPTLYPERPEMLFITLKETYDPGSGIAEFSYRIVDTQTGEVLAQKRIPYEDTRWYKTPSVFSEGPLRLEGREFRRRLLRIEVTLTNGAGLRTTAQRELDLLPRPPAQPSVSARVETSGWLYPMLRIQVSNIHDPEYGVRNIEYRVEDNETNAVLKDWTDSGVAFSNKLWTGQPLSTEILDAAEDYKGRRLRVSVRVTNGINISATATAVAASR